MITSWQQLSGSPTQRIVCLSARNTSAPPWIAIPFLCIFGLGLTAIALSALGHGIQKIVQSGDVVPLLALAIFAVMFLLLGFYLLREALYMTRQWKYAWGATFDISDYPAVRGKPLKGIIRHPRLRTFRDFDVVLAFIREYSDNDSRPSPSTTFAPGTAVWYERQRTAVIEDTGGAAIPVLFEIPLHLPEHGTYCQLEVRPALPGVVLFFEIPVLRVPFQ